MALLSNKLRWALYLSLSTLFLSACSINRLPQTTGLSTKTESSWSGKLNLTLDSVPKQSFSAEFDLQGDPQAGTMQFYTSLGTTLAKAQWTTNGADLVIPNKETLHFGSIQALSQRFMGASLPVDMIFAWANGKIPQAPEGWSVLESLTPPSGQGQSELRASRLFPLPQVQLRVWLNRNND